MSAHVVTTRNGSSNGETTIRLARSGRGSAPVKRDLYEATNEPAVIAFQMTALFDDDAQLTIETLMTRWGIGRPTATRARKTLIQLGYWAYVRPRRPDGTLGHEIRVWEDPATETDVAELALEYHAGTTIECGGSTYRVTSEGVTVSAGQTRRQKTATWSATARMQKTATWPDQEKRTRQQKTATWSHAELDGRSDSVSAGQTRWQKTAVSREKERENSKSSLSTDGGATSPGFAGPGDAPRNMDERLAVAVRELVVRRLPWEEWADSRETGFKLSPFDADQVQTAICEAMASAGITLEQAAVIGQTALGEAKSNPVGYVTDAFRRHLSRRLRSLVVEPLSDNPLPLLNKPKRQVGATKRAKQGEGAAAGTDAGEAAKVVLPACSTCDAREGEQYPAARTVTGDDGREHPCPDCLSPAA